MRTFQEFNEAFGQDRPNDFRDIEMRRFDGAAFEAKQKLDEIMNRLEELKTENDWEASPKQFAQLATELHAMTNDMTLISQQRHYTG
jgi:hypothetical protein